MLQINDIKEVRIDKALQKIGEAMLVVLPEEASWTPAEFLQHTKEHCESIASQLDAESRKVCAAPLLFFSLVTNIF